MASRKPHPVAPATSRPAGRTDPVVGNAAAATPGGASASDGGGGWLAEITSTPQAQPADGVPVDTHTKGDHHRGRAKESKRGQRT